MMSPATKRKLAGVAVTLAYLLIVVVGSATAYSKAVDLAIVGLGLSYIALLSVLLLCSRASGSRRQGRKSVFEKWRNWMTDSHPTFT